MTNIEKIKSKISEEKYKIVENIKDGYTNTSFCVLNKDSEKFFYQWKSYDGFNHKVDYELISNQDFSPKLISANKYRNIWEYIESQDISKKEKIKHSANILNSLHNSNLKISKNTILKRMSFYYKKAKKINKDVLPKEIDLYYKKAKRLFKSLDKNTPIHCDPWIGNFVFSKEKSYLVDFEYSSMGDKHWDIAYFIEGSSFNDSDKKYAYSLFKNIDHKKMASAIFVVNYIVILWLYQQVKYDLYPIDSILKTLNEWKD